MKYLGISSTNYSNSSRCLYSYLDNVEIVIVLNEEVGFFIDKICILLESSSTYNMYDVFEIQEDFDTDEDAKAFANTFAENVLKYRKNLLSYFHK